MAARRLIMMMMMMMLKRTRSASASRPRQCVAVKEETQLAHSDDDGMTI